MKISKGFIREVTGILFFCLGGSVVLTYFTCPPCHDSFEDYSIIALVSSSIWFFMWLGNSLLADYANKKISWTEFPIKRMVVGIISTFAYSIGIVVILTTFWNYILNNDYGNYYEVIIISLSITVVISLVLHSKAFLSNWKASQLEAEKFKRESIQAKYESLRSQVNPHFLFNSLNALTNLVYEDQDKAAKFIKQLSEVYRYVLDTREKEVVPLAEEIECIKSYLFLQQIRFGEKLQVEIGLKNVQSSVAPLALQMLIENAVKHNVIAEDSPLKIRVYDEDNFLVVENNLNQKSVLEESSAGLGLDNIRRRYEFLSTQKVLVNSGGGKFVVKLPVLHLNK